MKSAIISAIAVVAVASSSAFVAALPSNAAVLRHRSIPTQFLEPRSGYSKDADLLQPYADYRARFESWGCAAAHDDDTEFFDGCCHPLLKTQTIDDLPDVCFADCSDPTSTSAPASKPTSTKAPVNVVSKTSSSKTSTPTGTSGGDWNIGGQATYFYQGGNPGACGIKHPDSALIVAIDIKRYGPTSQASGLCGKKVEIMNANKGSDNYGKTVVATIADVCPTCTAGTGPGATAMNSIDLSVGTFKALESNLGVGAFNIKWKFV